jgi:hypothetical protein
MKAKTKRRLRHLLTKKKLVKKKTSRHVMRTVIVALATISTGSLAYAIALNKPTVSVAVYSSGPDGRLLSAPATPTPAPPKAGVPQSGRASWYALGLPAPDAITCASRTYPRGSYLEVTNERNGRVVTCRVNDYGPEAWTGRIIDLSRGSFRQIDSLGAGTAPVRVRLVPAPTGITLPIITDIGQIVGYNLCRSNHNSNYCEDHRRD